MKQLRDNESLKIRLNYCHAVQWLKQMKFFIKRLPKKTAKTALLYCVGKAEKEIERGER